MGEFTLIEADCIVAMAAMDEASVDAIVTDPPYLLGFMSKPWDIQLDHKAWATQALRVLKPGGHLLAFGGTRTYHRLACALEDAGFEIRDTLCWLYGSGFPKSLDVSKAIDKARDDSAAKWAVADWLRPHVERIGFDVITTAFGFGDETMARARWTSRSQTNTPTWDQWLKLKELCGFDGEMDAEVWRLNGRKGTPGEAWATAEVVAVDDRWNEPAGIVNIGQGERWAVSRQIKAPNSTEAERWQGWGTALKPAFEPIVLARKPLDGTVAQNVQEFGTGALNIDGTRIEAQDGAQREARNGSTSRPPSGYQGGWNGGDKRTGVESGRWPANVLLDEDAAALLDEQSGESKAGTAVRRHVGKSGGNFPFGAANSEMREDVSFGDFGGASRFFYVAKADREERNRGLGHREEARRATHGARAQGPLAQQTPQPAEVTGRNVHPTVKPVELMQWLCRLITPPKGTVLDPFTGSGSTGIAALREGFTFIGIEREPEYVEIARDRIIGDGPLLNVELAHERNEG